MAPDRTPLSIIIVTFNNADTIRDCLSSIPNGMAEIIIVDNASQDDTCNAITAEFPAVTLLRSPVNSGFAAAVMRGASVASGSRLLLVNPDAVLDGDCISRLMDFADKAPGHGIYGANARFADGRSNRLAGLDRPTFRGTLFAALGLRAIFAGSPLFDPEAVWPRLDQTAAEAVPVDVVSGACLLIARPLWDRLNGFDLRYFMYGEDADLCLRARQMGYDPVILPKATLVHHVAGSAASPASTQVFLLTARTTLAHTYGSPALRISIGLLHRLHVLLRLGASSIAPGSSAARRTDWRQVWRSRAIWARGYPAPPGKGPGR